MNTDVYFLIGGIILFFILINLLLYFYHKNRRTLFFRYIKDRNYTVIKNIESHIESYSKVSTKLTYCKADIVFLEQDIFIIPFNKPILQLRTSPEVYPYVSLNFKTSCKKIHDHTLEIKGDTSLGSFKISLNFKNKNFDLHSVVQWV
ncbi:hypothetical protein [Chryseobacterium shigense]|nr:hypothetical protein [Chryseobacterium shigense]